MGGTRAYRAWEAPAVVRTMEGRGFRAFPGGTGVVVECKGCGAVELIPYGAASTEALWAHIERITDAHVRCPPQGAGPAPAAPLVLCARCGNAVPADTLDALGECEACHRAAQYDGEAYWEGEEGAE